MEALPRECNLRARRILANGSEAVQINSTGRCYEDLTERARRKTGNSKKIAGRALVAFARSAGRRMSLKLKPESLVVPLTPALSRWERESKRMPYRKSGPGSSAFHELVER